MNKSFEEVLDDIVVEISTPIEKYLVEQAVANDSLYVQHYEAVKETFHGWRSGKEFKELEEKLDDTADALAIAQNSRDDFEREYKKLKVEHKQSSKIIVPDFMAEWLESDNLSELLKEWYCYQDEMPSHVREYLDRLPYNGTLMSSEIENNIVTFITRAKLEGYELEVEKLFYLENKFTGWYLYRALGGGYGEQYLLREIKSFQFTQEEIDLMDAGSYEKNEVEK